MRRWLYLLIWFLPYIEATDLFKNENWYNATDQRDVEVLCPFSHEILKGKAYNLISHNFTSRKNTLGMVF
jgi:hypothetical protein